MITYYRTALIVTSNYMALILQEKMKIFTPTRKHNYPDIDGLVAEVIEDEHEVHDASETILGHESNVQAHTDNHDYCMVEEEDHQQQESTGRQLELPRVRPLSYKGHEKCFIYNNDYNDIYCVYTASPEVSALHFNANDPVLRFNPGLNLIG